MQKAHTPRVQGPLIDPLSRSDAPWTSEKGIHIGAD